MTHDNTEENESEVESLTADRMFEILADGTRRSLLLELLERPPDDAVRLDTPEFVGPVLGGRTGPAEEAADRDGRDADRLRTELRHNHLPRLAAADVVRWDRDRETVKRGRGFAEIEPVLWKLDEISDELPADWNGSAADRA